MVKTLGDLRPVYVIGVGLHRYQPASTTPYTQLGLTAIRAALSDAGLAWDQVQSSHVATAWLGMGSGRPMLRHLGDSGSPIVHVENASASGSAAFRLACIEIASGMSDVNLVVGVDKLPPVPRAPMSDAGVPIISDAAIVPFTRYALLAREYQDRHGTPDEDIARVAVKNHNNGAKNPFAHRQQRRSLDEVMAGRQVSGSLTSLQCCPVGEGAAAVIVASDEGLAQNGIDPNRVVQVIASAAGSERAYSSSGPSADAMLTEETMLRVLKEAKVEARELNIVELHDAFSIEELLYVEAMGLCPRGHAASLLKEGAFDIGGQCAVSPSGGLIAMGHPVGPTGVGQVVEIVKQLRGDACERQHAGAKLGLAHMVGLGAVCYAHVFRRMS